MAKYLNLGLPPGAYRPGYEVHMVGEEMEYADDVEPSAGFVPLDEAALKVMQASKLKHKPSTVGDRSHVEKYIGQALAPRTSVPEKDEYTLSDLGKTAGGVVAAGGAKPGPRASDKKV